MMKMTQSRQKLANLPICHHDNVICRRCTIFSGFLWNWVVCSPFWDEFTPKRTELNQKELMKNTFKLWHLWLNLWSLNYFPFPPISLKIVTCRTSIRNENLYTTVNHRNMVCKFSEETLKFLSFSVERFLGHGHHIRLGNHKLIAQQLMELINWCKSNGNEEERKEEGVSVRRMILSRM